MEAELDRLQRVYAEMGDEPLINLASQPDELTRQARAAIDAELRRRRLQVHALTPFREDADGKLSVPADDTNERAYGFGAGIPGVVPAGGSAVETALEPGGEVRQGMLALVSLYDGHELTRACEVLEAAGIEFALEEIAGDASMGTPSRFEIWVEPSAQARCQILLRDQLGLFPLAEVQDAAGELPPGGDLVVGQFETLDEANQVRAMLTQHGFAARVESDDLPSGSSAVLVPAAEQERALDLLAARLGVS